MSKSIATARNMAAVKALFPECFTLSIVDAVGAATDKGAAIDLIARAIMGASLEYGHSGNDARIKSAREALQGKGKGAQVRARAVLALDTVRDSIKARELVALDDAHLCEWVSVAMVKAIDALTPPPSTRKAPAPAPTGTAPAPAPTGTAPAPAPTGTAPAATVDADDGNDAALAQVLGLIESSGFSVDQLMAISRALATASAKAPAPI